MPHSTETTNEEREIVKENKIKILELKSEIKEVKNSLGSSTCEQAEERRAGSLRPALRAWLVHATKKLPAHGLKKCVAPIKITFWRKKPFPVWKRKIRKTSCGLILDGTIFFFYLSKKDKRMKKYESLKSLADTITYTNRHIMEGEREKSIMYLLLGVVM